MMHRPSNAGINENRLALRPEDVAYALDMSRAHVFKLIKSGEIPSFTTGRARRVPVDELKAWMANQVAAQAKTAPDKDE